MLGVTAVLFVLLPVLLCAAAAVPPDSVNIDTKAGSYIAAGNDLSGRAVSTDGISKVVVDIFTDNGTYLGELGTSTNTVNSSVQSAYPGYPSGNFTGFSLDLGKALSAESLHSNTYYRFNAVAFTGAGKMLIASTRLYVPPDRMSISTQAGSSITNSGTFSG